MEIVLGLGERKILKLLGLWCQGIVPGFLPPCTSSEMTQGLSVGSDLIPPPSPAPAWFQLPQALLWKRLDSELGL